MNGSYFPSFLRVVYYLDRHSFRSPILSSGEKSNVVAAGTMGYVGVSRGLLGVPFVNPYHLYTFRNPAIIGGAVYGAIGGAMALFEGKTM